MADWQTEARRAAQRHGLDPDVFVRQIRQESGFNPNARSRAGALGIAQIMPATARSWGVDPLDPKAALDSAASHMAGYVRQFGSYANALVAYNAGPGRVGGNLPAETRNYIATILGGSSPSTAGVGSGQTADTAASSQGQVPAFRASAPTDFTGLLSKLLAGNDQAQPQQPVSGGIQAPQFSAGPALPQGFRPLAASAQAPDAQDALSSTGSLLDALRSAAPAQTALAASQDPRVQGPGIADQVASQNQTVSQTVANLPKGTATFEGSTVAAWIAPILRYARKQGWKGQVNSGYRTYEEQQRIYNSGVRPAARPGTSNHEGSDYPRGAVDVSDAAQLSQILLDSPYASQLVWAGAKDPVHFSRPHGGSY